MRSTLALLALLGAAVAVNPETERSRLKKLFNRKLGSDLGTVKTGRFEIKSALSLEAFEPLLGTQGLLPGGCGGTPRNAKEAYDAKCASIDALSWAEVGGDTPVGTHGMDNRSPEMNAQYRQVCAMSQLIASHYMASAMSTWLGAPVDGSKSHIPVAYTNADDQVSVNPELMVWDATRNTYVATARMRQSRAALLDDATEAMKGIFCGASEADEEMRTTLGSRFVHSRKVVGDGYLSFDHCNNLMEGVAPRYNSRLVANFESGCIAESRGNGDKSVVFSPFNCPIEAVASSLRTGGGGGSGPAGCSPECTLKASRMNSKETMQAFAADLQKTIASLSTTPSISEDKFNEEVQKWAEMEESLVESATQVNEDGENAKAELEKLRATLKTITTVKTSVVPDATQGIVTSPVKCSVVSADAEGFPGKVDHTPELPPTADSIERIMAPPTGTPPISSLSATAQLSFGLRCRVNVAENQIVKATVANLDAAKWNHVAVSVTPLHLPVPVYPDGGLRKITADYIPQFGGVKCDDSASSFDVVYTFTDVDKSTKVIGPLTPLEALKKLQELATADIKTFEEKWLEFKKKMQAFQAESEHKLFAASANIGAARKAIEDAQSAAATTESSDDQAQSEAESVQAFFADSFVKFRTLAANQLFTPTGQGVKSASFEMDTTEVESNVCGTLTDFTICTSG